MPSSSKSPLRLSDSVSSRVSMALRKAASAKLSGFTLAELIVVVAILAVLATVGLLALSGYREDARDAAVKANVRSVYSAIMAESSARQESPRCFVVHDPAYALSGGVVVFDSGLADSLSGWPCGTPGTNYSAWNPDYAALKLDPEKFRLSLLSPGLRGTPSGSRPAPFPAFRPPFLPASAAGTGSADPSLLLVGAADLADLSWPKPRIRTFAQVAAVLPSETAYVAGDFPTGGAEDGSVAGLVKDAAFASSSTGALVDGAPVGAPAPCPASEVSGYSVPDLGNGESAEVSKDVEDGRWTATASCSYGTVRIRDEAAVCDPDHVPASPAPSCVRDECSGTLPENSLSNGTPGTASWSRSETPGTCTFECDSANGYLWNAGTLSCEKSCSTGNLASRGGLAYVLPVALTVPNGGSAASSGTHAFGASPADGELSASFAFSCASGTLGTESSSGSASCASAPSYAFNSDFAAPACLPVTYAVSGSFGAGASGAQVAGCAGRTATADASGNFSFSGVLHGTDCSDVSVSKPGHSCSVSNQGPGSLASGVSDVAWSCPFDVAGLAGSLRFNGTNGYLSRTPASNGNRKTWTFSTWLKRTNKIAAGEDVYCAKLTGASYPNMCLNFENTGTIRIWSYNGSSFLVNKYTTQVFRDVSAWYHVVLVTDTSNSTAEDRIRLFVNGQRITSFGTNVNPSQNADLDFNVSGYTNTIGWYGAGSWGYFSGYFADVRFIDGQALSAGEFGETDAATGSWKPKNYSGTYGTNGFRLDFSDASALTSGSNAGIGKDSSGNSNYWNTNGVALADRVIDHPTDNFATLNPLVTSSNSNFSPNPTANGNLSLKTVNASYNSMSVGTIAPSSGKWYWEVSVTNRTDWQRVGIISPNIPTTALSWNGDYYFYDMHPSYQGYVYNGNTNSYGGSAYWIPWATGNTVGVGLDSDTGKLFFSINGVWQWSANPASGTNPAITWLTGKTYAPLIYIGNVSANQMDANFGQWGQSALQYCENAGGYFRHCPPSGFKALSTKNLPTPAIANPKQHFDVLTYAGDSNARSITGLSFQPDFVWTKDRSVASSHRLHDSVRWGNGSRMYALKSDSTWGEGVDTLVSGLISGGFSVLSWADHPNVSGRNFVAWNWKAGGGTASANTAGSVQSQVSANPTAGFSVVTYTGNGVNGPNGANSIGHGLWKTPSFYITKNRDGYNASQGFNDWSVWHKDLPTSTAAASNGHKQCMWLHSNAAAANGAGGWSGTPTSTTFYPNQQLYDNVLNRTYVAYVWTEIPGYSKFGSYVGNGSTDGPFVHTGFRPRWILIKSSTLAGMSWTLLDTARDPYNTDAQNYLLAELSQQEYSSPAANGYPHIFANGFKLRWTSNGVNGSGQTYVYAAFAEAPFWGAGIAPATAR